ncbi:prephenate dehydratase [Candidatus Bipolaricaulota sp. J31]
MVEVAFQGERGAFSEEAAVVALGPGIEPIPCRSFPGVFSAVAEGRATYGVIPIENSLTGSIHTNYDLLLAHDLHIVGETEIPIRHCLLALPGVRLAGIQRVLSHPQALAQCERTLRALLPWAELVPVYDTAGSALILRREGLRDAAAIAGRRAAEIYGMEVLVEDLADSPENYTRFLVLGREPVVPEGPAKTSIVFAAENVPGALYRCLEPFATRGIDLTKIESRPVRERRWEYLFYVDFAGSAHEDRCREALEELRGRTTFLRVLGSYPRMAR